MDEDQVSYNQRNFSARRFWHVARRGSLTGVALLGDILANGCWDLAGIQKLLKPHSTIRQANEALCDGSSYMGTRKKG